MAAIQVCWFGILFFHMLPVVCYGFPVFAHAGESAYYEAVGSGSEKFSRTYVIPKPFDERLLPEVAAAVLEAAIASGVARLTDIDVVAYKRQLADLSIRMNL